MLVAVGLMAVMAAASYPQGQQRPATADPAVPKPDPSRRARKEIPSGEIPDATAPPAHCRFHPRCPRAFAPCGFEARDLVDALEARWTGLGEEAFASERALLGRMAPHGRTLIVMPGSGGRLGASGERWALSVER